MGHYLPPVIRIVLAKCKERTESGKGRVTLGFLAQNGHVIHRNKPSFVADAIAGRQMIDIYLSSARLYPPRRGVHPSVPAAIAMIFRNDTNSVDFNADGKVAGRYLDRENVILDRFWTPKPAVFAGSPSIVFLVITAFCIAATNARRVQTVGERTGCQGVNVVARFAAAPTRTGRTRLGDPTPQRSRFRPFVRALLAMEPFEQVLGFAR